MTTPDPRASGEIEPQPSFLRPQDFPEDFSHENGNYQCRCYRCGHTFVGHKRRVTCKLCVTIDALTHECARKDAEIAKMREQLRLLESAPLVSGERVMRNLPDGTIIGNYAWWIPQLWRAACHAVRDSRNALNPGAPRDGE